MRARYVITCVLLTTVLVAPLMAMGGGEDAFNEWYGSVGDFFNETEAQRTGLTAFPTLLIPMGGVHEGLATATTAVVQDTSVLESNPAGSAILDEGGVAVFHSNLIADTSMESFAFTARREDLGFGVSVKHLHVPFTAYDLLGEQTSTSRFSESIVTFNVAYNFFNSFYFRGLTVGMNMKGAQRTIDESVAPFQSGGAFMVDAGALTRFNALKFFSSPDPNVTVGATVLNIGTPAQGDPLPSQWRAGLSWSPVRPLMLSSDYIRPFSFSDDPVPDPGWAVGSSLTVTNFLSLRTGFLYRPGSPRFTLGSTVEMDRLALKVNYTVDLTTQFSRMDRFSVTAQWDLGDQGRSDRRDRVRLLYSEALQAFATGNLEETVAITEEILLIDRSFQPAAETQQMAARMLELQEQMEAIRATPGGVERDE